MEGQLLISNNPNVDGLSTGEAAFLGGFVGTLFIFLIIFAVLVIVGEWKIFEKAGEKGWKSIIPIYGQYILFKIAGASKWFWALFCVTIVSSIMMAANSLPVDFNASQAEINAQLSLINFGDYVIYLIGLFGPTIFSLVVSIILSIKLAKAFDKGLSYILGLIFIPEIVLIVLGFGKAKYNKKAVSA